MTDRPGIRCVQNANLTTHAGTFFHPPFDVPPEQPQPTRASRVKLFPDDGDEPKEAGL